MVPAFAQHLDNMFHGDLHFAFYVIIRSLKG